MPPNSLIASVTASRTAAGILFEDLHYNLASFVNLAVGLVLLLTQILSMCLAALPEAPTLFPYPVVEDPEHMSSSCLQDHRARMQHDM